MAKNSTQRYIDNEKSFLSGMLPGAEAIPVKKEVDIDVDIEKQISQLQEARINGTLESKSDLPVDPDKQLKEWQLEKDFAGFLDSVGKEKEDTSKKIEEEEQKISALEDLFDDLMAAKSGKKKKLLLEPEKVKVEPVKLKEKPKPIPEATKEEIEKRYVGLPKEEVFIDENARRIVAEKYGELGNATLHSFLSPKEIESDPNIINKVVSHIKEMKVANELEKEKMTGLKSIDTLEKLTREFLNFKHITSMQMGTIGGGGGVQLLDMDDVNVSSKTNGYILKYNSSTERMDFVDPASLNSTLVVADGGTIGSTTTTDAITIAADGDVTLSGDLKVEGTTTTIDSTTISIQNAFVFEGATADSYETTLTTVDPTADRTISLPNVSGTIPVLAAASATQISSTPEELNILDGVTSTAAEINLIDGGTSRGTTAVASGDGILINDGGTMRMTNVDTVSTYFSSHNVGGGNIVTTGALDSGSITSGFGTIDTGSSAITTTGLISGGSLDIDNVLINGTTIGHTDDTDLMTVADGVLTVAGELDAVTLDISGNADIDGTLEADAITVDGTTLAEYISDTAGGMVSSNTETGITVTYQDSDNTIDFAVDAAQTGITSIYNTGLVLGYGASHANIDFGTDNRIVFDIDGTSQVLVLDGVFRPTTDSDVDLGASAKYWKDAYIDTITTTGNLIMGGTIGHADDTDLMTIADGILTVAGEVSMTTLDIGGTNITATAAELNYSDGVTSALQTQIDAKGTKGFAIASAIVFG